MWCKRSQSNRAAAPNAFDHAQGLWRSASSSSRTRRKSLEALCKGVGSRIHSNVTRSSNAACGCLLCASSLQLTGKQRAQRGKAFTAQCYETQRTQVQTLDARPHLAIYDIDRDLQQYDEHMMYRWQQYTRIKNELEQHEGGLLQFAKGYEKLGFTREGSNIVYREWAPTATAVALIGDFNNWAGSWMERDEFGVWTLRLPDGVDGKPAIEHGSRVKVRLCHADGWSVDRVPAWITRATMPPGRMGATFDGIYWSPPPNEQYRWQHERPRLGNQSLRIYEAHVGMSSEEPVVASYTHFKDEVLPRVKALGYNAIQLMAVQEHAYYGSFGYHVTNPFAVSSRCGTPEELKALVDAAHGMGIKVLLDIVHSHISKNLEDGLAGFDLGQGEDMNYFCSGERGYHQLWDSRLLNYRNWEVLRYLLSNVRWWLEEYKFDGFRFDGVTSMLYHHHGINVGFSGNYNEYFSTATNVDAVVYLMLANDLTHTLVRDAITVAEDVSGMPGLCRPVKEGGVGFDYRLAMGIPDKWIQILKHQRDENWSMQELVATLCNRRYTEKTIAYAESHDQALVGDKTVAMWLMDAEMYRGMSALQPPSPIIERGVALHKCIRLLTMALGGEGWLNFMGNEFGHPEWIDFPREGNDWSHQHCRRQWSLADTDHLRYKFLNAWDAAMQALESRYGFMTSPHQIVSFASDTQQVIVAERGELVFVFNFSPFNDYEGFKVGVGEPGKYRVVLDSDAWDFGGLGRVGHDVDHFTQPEGIPGQPETNFNDRPHSMMVLAPSRTAVVYARVPEQLSNNASPAPAATFAPASPPSTPEPFYRGANGRHNGVDNDEDNVDDEWGATGQDNAGQPEDLRSNLDF